MEGAPQGKSLPPRTVEVMAHLEQHIPTVPDELVLHLLRRSGDEANDKELVRLIGLAGERFLSTILTDAMQIMRRKQSVGLKERRQLGYAGGTGKKDSSKALLLAEDVAEALREFGITVRAAPYFVNH
uniref:Transcription initiation factor TFIID subunit 10 n=1 Tax=Tetradesmus obliquus TaxID=3088 RepID=A0A383W5W2_TETOB|eukprot:jgi/Sobl393_1/17086/SZX72404.1